MIVGDPISIEGLRHFLEIGDGNLGNQLGVVGPAPDVPVLAMLTVCTESELVVEALVLFELVLVELVIP